MKKIKLIKFDDIYDENKRITNYKPIDKDKTFTDDGIYSEVIFGSLNDNNIEDIGWICTDNKYIINPIMYNHIEKLIGKPKLEKMLKYNKSISREGEVLELDLTDDNPEEDDNMGLYEFKEHFVEMIEKWGNKTKYKKEYEFIMHNQAYVWTDKLPVFNSKMRPKHVGPIIVIL